MDVGVSGSSSDRQMFNHCYFNVKIEDRYIGFPPAEGGHGGRVVTLSPPTSEIGVRSLARPQVGKLVFACCWLAGYSTEP